MRRDRCTTQYAPCFVGWLFTDCYLSADPGKQFDLVCEHIGKLRAVPGYAYSRVIIYVERNLGFEAEHHQRALNGLQVSA